MIAKLGAIRLKLVRRSFRLMEPRLVGARHAAGYRNTICSAMPSHADSELRPLLINMIYLQRLQLHLLSVLRRGRSVKSLIGFHPKVWF